MKSGDKIKVAKMINQDKLDFINISNMLSPIDGTISDIVQ